MLATMIPILALLGPQGDGQAAPRRPAGEAELRFWLENMVVHHGYSIAEVSAATGLDEPTVAAESRRLGLDAGKRGDRDGPRILPYPGGRHPRLGFLDGAVGPQRETKASVFTPWDDGPGYVVVDLPEAIWSDLGLTYLAHTHVPTIWTARGVALEPREWERRDGGLAGRRVLPNGIAFDATIDPAADGSLRMRLSITNGTDRRLTRLRAQVCVMTGRAPGFEAQTDADVQIRPPYVARRAAGGRRWIITAWEPLDRGWANPPCPCLHADPSFPDCEPGATVRAIGALWFAEGDDLDAILGRIDGSGWRTPSE